VQPAEERGTDERREHGGAGQERQEDGHRANAEASDRPRVREAGDAGHEQGDDQGNEHHPDGVHPQRAERLDQRGGSFEQR
jgi:hypothetical protein